MSVPQETLPRLANLKKTLAYLTSIHNLTRIEDAPLSAYTRFGIGGPADVLVQTADEGSFIAALRVAWNSGLPWAVIGSGTNLIISDEGFRGIVLRFTGNSIRRNGSCVSVQAGAELQSLVDFTASHGLKGLETMTGIPGSVGAAIYGNAGAYGHSMMEIVRQVRFFDGEAVTAFTNAQCEFVYRESIFKRHKDWIIFSADLQMEDSSADLLLKTAAEILAVRNEKYPITMKCAGSIFKNLIMRELPEPVASQVPAKLVREGKAPSAWFLEQVDAKGMRVGAMKVADYHANLIYNLGGGTAAELLELIHTLKARVWTRFELALEEEVQYVGFAEGVHRSSHGAG